MDLIKKLTGKNPDEYNVVTKALVDNSDIKLFKELVSQEDFLFDFIKSNVAKRIQNVCTKDNYKNLIKFFEFYSPSYDLAFAEILYKFGKSELLPTMKNLFLNTGESQKAYIAKYFSLLSNSEIEDLLPEIRIASKSEFEPLAVNAIEILSKFNDETSKQEALENLKSDDEFMQYNAVKFLVNYQAKDTVPEIINTMKHSSLAENIASEIPYLISSEELLEKDFENGILVLCHIVNAIPEIISPSATLDYNLYSVFNNLYQNNLNSSSATLLMLAKDKFAELTSNEEYLFDCDKNTKDEVNVINELLKNFNKLKLKNLLYDELFEESNLIFFALDYVDEIEVLETLLDSQNPTLVLKILSLIKDKFTLTNSHKETALKNIKQENIKSIIAVL